jgi:hypothetical protein
MADRGANFMPAPSSNMSCYGPDSNPTFEAVSHCSKAALCCEGQIGKNDSDRCGQVVVIRSWSLPQD